MAKIMELFAASLNDFTADYAAGAVPARLMQERKEMEEAKE